MLEVTKENFESEVLQAEGYVFVDFFGDGCVPCAALMPHVHALADKYADLHRFQRFFSALIFLPVFSGAHP